MGDLPRAMVHFIIQMETSRMIRLHKHESLLNGGPLYLQMNHLGSATGKNTKAKPQMSPPPTASLQKSQLPAPAGFTIGA